jgi:predicted dehydrogenase
MDLTESRVIVEKPDKEKEVHDYSDLKRNELFVNEINHFFDCVANRQQPVVTVEDGANSLRIALAIKESMETGKIISLE